MKKSALLLVSPVVAAVGVFGIDASPPASASAISLAPCQFKDPIDLSSLATKSALGCDPEGLGLALPDGRLAIIPSAGGAVTASYLNDPAMPGPSDYFLAVSAAGDVGIELTGWRGESRVSEVFGSADAIADLRSNDKRDTEIQPRDTSTTCTSDAYELLGHDWSGGYAWKFSEYPYIGTDVMEDFWIYDWDGGYRTQGQETNCDGSDYPIFNMPTITYNGMTSSRPNVSVLNNVPACGLNDGQSVHGFDFFTAQGSGLASTLAVTCTWTFLGATLASDIAYDIQRPWHFYDGGSCASGEWDFRSVAMHEWGHVWGLDHVPVSQGQMMRPTLPSCFVQDTLGLGDLTGLAQIYG